MMEYHKIQSLYKRDERGKMLFGEYSLPEFAYLASNEWDFTEKVDGTNIRIMWDCDNIKYGGKTDNAQIPNFLVNRLVERFGGQEHLFKSVFGEATQACLYGEGYGAKIQKGGGNYRTDQDFVLFDVWVDGWWLMRDGVADVARKMSLDVVPSIGTGTLSIFEGLVRSGIKSKWGDFQAEGIVARPSVPLFTRRGDRIITKLKSKDFVR